MSRLASVSALWVLLGFVLGGLAAPMLHVVQHVPECAHAESHHAHAGHAHAEHAHEDTTTGAHPAVVAADDDEPPCFACALCAVQLTSTNAGAKAFPEAPRTTGELGLAAAAVPDSPAATPYAPRGPPAC
ncbi:MAG: hypothetical protein AAF624_09320 [Bacteroidota bacterium]